MGGKNSKDEHWQKDSVSPNCHKCGTSFTFSNRRHHCRNCGYIFCTRCSRFTSVIPMRQVFEPVRVCSACFRTLCGSGSFSADSPVAPMNRSTDSCAVGESQNLHRSRSLQQESAGRQSGAGEAPRVQSAGPWDREGNSSVGPGVVFPSGIPSGADTGEGSNSAFRQWDLSANAQLGGAGNSEAVADQLEKNRLLQCWRDVRQKAIFADVLLQQVEKVTVNTVVEYSRETESIVLQPELPVDQLHTIFAFPPATEGNAQLLVEPVDVRSPASNSEAAETSIRLVEQQLFLPQALSMPKCESCLLRQY